MSSGYGFKNRYVYKIRSPGARKELIKSKLVRNVGCYELIQMSLSFTLSPVQSDNILKESVHSKQVSRGLQNGGLVRRTTTCNIAFALLFNII